MRRKSFTHAAHHTLQHVSKHCIKALQHTEHRAMHAIQVQWMCSTVNLDVFLSHSQHTHQQVVFCYTTTQTNSTLCPVFITSSTMMTSTLTLKAEIMLKTYTATHSVRLVHYTTMVDENLHTEQNEKSQSVRLLHPIAMVHENFRTEQN